jgi:hypothetical protein
VPQNGIKPLASVMDIDELRTRKPGFMVQAYTSGTTSWNDWTDGARTATPNFMPAQTVTWSGGTSTSASWAYSPIQYWPVSDSNWDKVSFFAYTHSLISGTTVTFAPAGATNENPKLYYTMPTYYSTQRELIVDAEYNLTGNADKVTFKFDHVLSRIGFQAKALKSYAPATVTMSGMDFRYGNLRGSGTYTFTGSNKDPGNWDVTDGKLFTIGTELLTSPARLSGTMTYNISEPARYLMLIPQENPAANRAYVLVSYTIIYPAGDAHSNVDEKYKIVYLPEIIWKPGIAYTYTLNIAGPREMIFHVSEGDDWNVWEDEEPDDIFHFHP